MKVAIYARVSTHEQDAESQLNDLRNYCKARNFEIYDEYIDVGESGSKESRPKFNEMLDNAYKHKFDAILVWKLDRFSRSLKHLLNTLDELSSRGIEFISYTNNIDTTTPQGKLLFSIVGAFSEFEREMIKERVKAGLRKAKAKGKKLGRRGSGVDIRLLHELKRQGKSLRQMAKEVGVSHVTVRRLLQKPS